MTTYSDIIEHVSAYLGKDATSFGASAVRRAIQAAMLDWPSIHDWCYYQSWTRINTVAQQTDGTIAFDLTGGANERQLTLTDATWPSWALYGMVRIAGINYAVQERVSSTILILTEATAPTADIASGTEYAIARQTYPLPANFLTMGIVSYTGTNQGDLCSVPDQYITSLSSTGYQTGLPSRFSVVQSQADDGTLAVRFWPVPSDAYSFDCSYRRRPLEVVNDSVSTGTVSTTSGSAVVTGTGTSFTSRLIGSVIRISSDTTLPTGRWGLNNAIAERKVLSVASATSLTVSTAWADTVSRVAYVCSDPVDCEPTAMLNAFLRHCEKQARLVTRMKPIPGEDESWLFAMAAAREADNRDYGPESMMGRSNAAARYQQSMLGPVILV